HRPVRNSARVGEQTGCTKNRSKRAPSEASESMCGVRRLVLPLTLRSPQPWSSARMTTTFGFSAALASRGRKPPDPRSATATRARIVRLMGVTPSRGGASLAHEGRLHLLEPLLHLLDECRLLLPQLGDEPLRLGVRAL